MTAGWCAQVSAQALQHDITVEHDVVLQKREALKRALTPTVQLPPVTLPTLQVIGTGVGIDLQPMGPVLGAMESDAAAPDTLHHGYAAFGYFPAYNLAGSAGYSGSAGNFSGRVWLQFDGRAFKRTNLFDENEGTYRDNTFTLGAEGQMNTSVGRFALAADYTGAWYNMPMYDGDEPDLKSQSASNVHVRLTFNHPSRQGGVRWNAGVAVGHFGFGKPGALPIYIYDYVPYFPSTGANDTSAAKETNVSVSAGLSTTTSDNSSVALDATFDFQHDNHRPSFDYMYRAREYRYQPGNSESVRLLTFRPSWRTSTEQFTAHIGAKVQITGGGGKVFHIAPDVLLAWTPATQFAIYGKAGGGEHLNTLESLFADVRYIQPMMSYGISHVPLTLEAGLKAGPWSGFAIRAYAKYAKANEWLMPIVPDMAQEHPVMLGFGAVDIRGALLGAQLSYAAGRTAEVSLGYEYSPTDPKATRGWWEWRDRARSQVTASATVRPIAPLSINATWRFRDGRQILDEQVILDQEAGVVGYDYQRKLGSISDLSVGASWALNSDVNVWLTLENLLGRSWQQLGFVPSQGFHGLAGISCKF